jgi:hypothetical protein
VTITFTSNADNDPAAFNVTGTGTNAIIGVNDIRSASSIPAPRAH